MRIKIIGDNNCARATRQLLRMAGFAVTEFLPAEAITRAPHFGYAITIELAPAALTPSAVVPKPGTMADSSAFVPEVGTMADAPAFTPGLPTHGQPAADREGTFAATKVVASVSSPASAPGFGVTAGRPAFSPGDRSTPRGYSFGLDDGSSVSGPSFDRDAGRIAGGPSTSAEETQGRQDDRKTAQAEACATQNIHFDSVDCALEAAVLRHVAQLAVVPVVVDRPGGVVHSERELRIVVPLAVDVHGRTGMDEAAAVAVEFGVLRGLLDLVAPKSAPVLIGNSAAGVDNSAVARNANASAEEDKSAVAPSTSRSAGGRKKRRWAFGLLSLAGALLAFVPNSDAAPLLHARSFPGASLHVVEARGADGAYLHFAAALAAIPPQGQFVTGQGTKITDGTNTLVVDPCKAQTKVYVSINQTANTQLVAGTASKKIYICSIHVVVAAATNVALVEGTGTVCATGTTGVSGFGGATAATGWNFAGNSGIALGNGDAAVGAQGTAADNLCLYNSGSGQVSGGISYVVQ